MCLSENLRRIEKELYSIGSFVKRNLDFIGTGMVVAGFFGTAVSGYLNNSLGPLDEAAKLCFVGGLSALAIYNSLKFRENPSRIKYFGYTLAVAGVALFYAGQRIHMGDMAEKLATFSGGVTFFTGFGQVYIARLYEKLDKMGTKSEPINTMDKPC